MTCRTSVRHLIIIAAFAATSVAGRVDADQTAGQSSAQETVSAGQQYRKPIGGRLLFGKDYRDLWTASIPVEVLDLRTTAGGLRAVMTVGGNESRGLALKGGDGRDYSFRPVKKDLRGIVADVFQDSIVADIVEDQVAATIPGVEVVKPVLANAVGVLIPAGARLVVLPDDPGLGRFQKEFAHALGVLLEYPQPVSATNPGFHGATAILGHKEFWDRRRASASVQADSRAFLRARLLDILINDWDRHQGQWRWAQLPGQARLQPIPEDADMALSSYRGLALSAARAMGAPYVTFDGRFSPLPAVTKNGWAVDRFLLTDIPRVEWRAIATAVQSAVTDSVIDEAIGRLPARFRDLRGAELIATLRSRRDRLVDYADRFYLYLASAVDVHGSDEVDWVRAEWQQGGDLVVSLRNTEDGEPYYRRRFTSRETGEVRIYLHAGGDIVDVSRRRHSDITLRIIGGAGDDRVRAEDTTGLHVYDSEGRNEFASGNRDAIDQRAFALPAPSAPNDLPWVPAQDWGRATRRTAAVSYSVGPGVVVGAGLETHGRGFRSYPWANRQSLRAAWSFGTSKPLLDYVAAVRRQDSSVHGAVSARVSGIEQVSYFGLGNETPTPRPGDATVGVSQFQAEVFPALLLSNDRRAHVAFGPYLSYTSSGGSDPGSVLATTRPLGSGTFRSAGVRGEAAWDSRRARDVFARGVTASVMVRQAAQVLDVDSAFGSVTGALSITAHAGPRVAWTLRSGGKATWGAYPYFEAAYVDHRTTAGYSWNRFGGDASLYGGGDMHITLGTTHHVVPGDYGLTVFADAGRVFLEGQASSRWHPAAGAGLFYAPFKRSSLVGVKVGKNDERWFVTVETRFASFGF